MNRLIAKAQAEMSRNFGRYKRESELAVRTLEVKGSETLAQLKEAWRNTYLYRWDSLDGLYKKSVSSLKDINYSAKDVENFSVVLAEFQKGFDLDFNLRAGIFLSALINNGKDGDYIIYTNHCKVKPICVGYKNYKSIKINGDVGAACGCQMIGGKIIINGNTDYTLGLSMAGGIIIVNGDVESLAGQLMRGGEIHLNGSFRDLGGPLFGGKIFYRGKLIFSR